MNIHLKITGILLIALAIIHIIFPNYFSWKKDLASLSLINRQMMYVHTFFIGLIVFLMGIFCLVETEEIITTTLGHQLAFGLFIFWFTRLLFQLFVYSSKLWQGKRFETAVHFIFSVLWTYFSIVFFLIYR